MSHRVGNPPIWVSDQVRRKQARTVTETGYKFEISDLRRRGIEQFCTIYVTKTKAQ